MIPMRGAGSGKQLRVESLTLKKRDRVHMLWRLCAKALNHHASLGYMKMEALSYSSFVVEVPGIEPGSFGIQTGLLRA